MRARLTVAKDSTGRLGAPAATVSIPTNPNNCSVAWLTQVHQSTGGFIVNLNGRFRPRMIATVGTDGKVNVACEGGEHNDAKEHRHD